MYDAIVIFRGVAMGGLEESGLPPPQKNWGLPTPLVDFYVLIEAQTSYPLSMVLSGQNKINALYKIPSKYFFGTAKLTFSFNQMQNNGNDFCT
jgi:hypothetical protein